MGKILFIDESGKTGTQRYTEQLWNFSNQPYFAMCGLLVAEEKVNELNEFVRDLRRHYKIQGEIKATKKSVINNRESIMSKLWEKQEELSCELFIEVVNKKFCMAMMITNYCIFPYYDIPKEYINSDERIKLLQIFANYIYQVISDSLLGEFVEFFDNNTQGKEELIELCLKLIKEIDNEKVIKYINETIDSIKELNIGKHNIFPLINHYKGQYSTVAVCPHIDSFNNILTKINNLKDLKIIHDEIEDLKEAIVKNAELREITNVQFGNSREVDILQIVDFWVGNIKDSIKCRLKDNNINDITNDITEKIIQTRVNFVSSFKEQELIFPTNKEIRKLEGEMQKIFGFNKN